MKKLTNSHVNVAMALYILYNNGSKPIERTNPNFNQRYQSNTKHIAAAVRSKSIGMAS